MLDKEDYMARLERARKRRDQRTGQRNLIFIAGGLILLILLGFGIYRLRTSGKPAAAETGGAEEETLESTEPETEAPTEPTLSPEEEAAQQLAQEVQGVLDSYTDMGLIRVEGYLNVREAPGSEGKIIGKLMENSACEILDTEGEWAHITSGGIEGYINAQYLLTGDEAKEAARPYVVERAIIRADKLNIRSEPNGDADNVVGQALQNER